MGKANLHAETEVRKAEVDVTQSSVGELLGEVVQDLTTLMRQEMELAKVELRQDAVRAGRAGGMLGGAGVAGHMVLLFLSFALWWGLSNVMDQGWAALIVAALWAVIAAVLYVKGRERMREMRGLPKTAETIKEIPDALKG
ncbi:MAG: phage holin family protein, partial [Longispora sp.]|nr:phage holin family protein [Longispora sp. (in: high G+C Gram-positive bacteria)]